MKRRTNSNELRGAIRRKCRQCKQGSKQPILSIENCEDQDCPLWSFRVVGREEMVQEKIASVHPTAYALGYFLGGGGWTVHKPGQGFYLYGENSEGELKTVRTWEENGFAGSPSLFNTYVKRVCEDYCPMKQPIPLISIDLATLKVAEVKDIDESLEDLDGTPGYF